MIRPPKAGERVGAWTRSKTWILIGLVALTLLGGLAFYRPFAAHGEGTGGGPPVPAPPAIPGSRQTFLVMGVDDRPGSGGRADSMIVVSYDPSKEQLSMLSLPRDTWANIPGEGYDKINHSYAFGGASLAHAAVQQLLGIPIDHTVTLSFQGFIRIVDELGGVEIDAEKRLFYEDPDDTGMGPEGLKIDIQPGLQKMDGMTALGYARFRMDEEGDFGRVRRQQQVMKALMKTAGSPSVLGRITQLVPAVASAVKTDLSVAEMLKLALGGTDALKNPLRTATITGEDRYIGGVYYMIPDLVKARTTAFETLIGTAPPEDFLSRARQEQQANEKAVAEATADEPPPVAASNGEAGETPKSDPASPEAPPPTQTTKPQTQQPKPQTKPRPITVAVIDASGKNLASAYVTKLKAAGFRVARVATSARQVPQTVALDHAGQAGTLDRLTSVLGKVSLVSVPDKTAAEAVEIILGQDLN